VRVHREIVLPAAPADAWAILTDWEGQATWMRDADHVVVTSATREGVGTTVAVKTRVLNVPLFTERLEVVGWDPPHALQVAHRSLIRGVGTWTLEPAGTGTRFRWTEELSLPVPLLGELALHVYRPFMRRLMGLAMRDLQASAGEDA
jgi:polyketide cyclase/dehydrase/lipid transport protein